MLDHFDQSDVRALFAEARRIAGGRPGGALRLMLLRLRRNRAEDLAVRSTVSRVLTLDGVPAPDRSTLPVPQLLKRRGYRPLRANQRVWVHAGSRTAGDLNPN
jgi:hypothetical protein